MAKSPLSKLREALSQETTDVVMLACAYGEKANGNASRNTYLHFDPDLLVAQARALPLRFPEAAARPVLFGVPVSLKDCFDLAGVPTTCGSAFYARSKPPSRHSAIAQQLLDAGCLITGKTHLHSLAYGITGQNADFGDCLQPRDATLLTGGSSSGAAASVQEGSALAAIGTDTGGSIRVPAALCGLVGYRTSRGLAAEMGGWPGLWEGATHLAPSFDTPGLLFRDARDAQLLGYGIFRIPLADAPQNPVIGFVAESFLADCEPECLEGFRTWKLLLAQVGATMLEFDAGAWRDSVEIFAGIQAHEAAAIHRGRFHHFEPAIAQRLAWGESLSSAEIGRMRKRHSDFNVRFAKLWEQFDLLMLPCAPVSRLRGDVDQSASRQAILRYTTPFSLAGLPTIALPGESIGAGFGTGVQIAAAPGRDGILLAYAAMIAERFPPA